MLMWVLRGDNSPRDKYLGEVGQETVVSAGEIRSPGGGAARVSGGEDEGHEVEKKQGGFREAKELPGPGGGEVEGPLCIMMIVMSIVPGVPY